MKSLECFISSITAYELQKGIQSKGPGVWSNDLQAFLDLSLVVPFGSEAARAAANVTASLKKQGKPSGLADELIAGHAISLGMTLVTNNAKHYEGIPGLKIENWL
jgi:tRNA(fMet)-specific endonuclease VapC